MNVSAGVNARWARFKVGKSPTRATSYLLFAHAALPCALLHVAHVCYMLVCVWYMLVFRQHPCESWLSVDQRGGAATDIIIFTLFIFRSKSRANRDSAHSNDGLGMVYMHNLGRALDTFEMYVWKEARERLLTWTFRTLNLPWIPNPVELPNRAVTILYF